MMQRTPGSAAIRQMRFSYVSLLDAAARGIRVETENGADAILGQMPKAADIGHMRDGDILQRLDNYLVRMHRHG